MAEAARSKEPLRIEYARTDDDVIAIHGFLCVVAGPTLPGPIDAKNSIEEIWRVCTDELALMAMDGDRLVGTLGLVNAPSWWNKKVRFLANRWFFALPDSGAGQALIRDGIEIAKASGLELHVYDETKGRLAIFNKSKNRRHTHVLR